MATDKGADDRMAEQFGAALPGFEPPGEPQDQPGLDFLKNYGGEQPMQDVGPRTGRQGGRPPNALVAFMFPGTLTRLQAWWAHPKRRDLMQRLTYEEQKAVYLEVASYRDAAADEERGPTAEDPTDNREYAWLELHMEGLKAMIDAEVEDREREVAAAARREARRAFADKLLGQAKKLKLPPDLIQLIADEREEAK